MSRKILVTSALPYSNGHIHIGHIAGAYLPADIYVRYHKQQRNDIIFICGADEHGVPITIAAMQQGITPRELVDKNYTANRDSFAGLGIDFDNFSRTSLPVHYETSQEFFLALNDKGKLKKKEVTQFYCPEDKMFLADRYVRGICPKCGAEDARGDQCEKCGSWLDSLSLKEPRCALCGTTPEVKSTAHWYLPMAEFQAQLEKWLEQKKEWKNTVMNYCKGWFKEGLRDRAITRDLDWGVPVPLPDGEGKVMYVWFDAPIGYISSTKEWAKKNGEPDKWKDYWCDENTELVHFIGKDNIVFHAIFWPAVLMEVGGYILPTSIPANEFLNLEGRKLSTSQNYAVWLPDYLEKYPPDILRYALAASLPESKDSDFSWKDFQRFNNDELADILGNFVNRTLTFIEKRTGNVIPPAHTLTAEDIQVIDDASELQKEVAELIDTFHIRGATHKAMDIARRCNQYFDASEPWKTRKTDMERCETTLHVCCQLIRGLCVVFHPFIPYTTAKLWKMIGCNGTEIDVEWDTAFDDAGITGQKLGKIEILFTKLEDSDIQPEIDRLESIIKRISPEEETAQKTKEKKSEKNTEDVGLITIDDFAKVQLRTAHVTEAERVPKTDKLLKLQIDIGTEKRQIVAGIAKEYSPEEIVGKTVVVVANLEPAQLRGITSEGMLLAASVVDGLHVVTVDADVPPGCIVR